MYSYLAEVELEEGTVKEWCLDSPYLYSRDEIKEMAFEEYAGDHVKSLFVYEPEEYCCRNGCDRCLL